MKKKMKLVLIVGLAIIIVVAGIFIWERAHVTFYVDDATIPVVMGDEADSYTEEEQDDKLSVSVSNNMEDTTSVSIIGGADGPTAIFLAGKIDNTSGENEMGYTQINMEMAKSIFEETGDYIILDVRRSDEFAEGHIPGAINVANESIGEDEIAELPDKSQTIYVYCRSGNRSKQAAEKLVKLGYENIIEFGGIMDWTGEIEK